MNEEEKNKSALKVNAGIDQPSMTNDDAIKRFKNRRRQSLSAEEYVAEIREGNLTKLSQAITLIESAKAEHQTLAGEIIEKCIPHSGNSIRIGITGIPGVGKSTFIEALGKHITRQGKKLAVLAIDPSSERSKGSILGDKTRMEDLSTDKNAFIRPSPSAGSLGGVARKTRESVILCEAAGFEIIFIETVGVGQSETAVHSMVDFFLLLMLAGAGDELQGIKRGIMEMADAITINKADGNNIDKASMAKREYENALHLFPPTESGWAPKVLTSSALKKTGIDELWDTIHEYLTLTRENGFFKDKRKKQAHYWMMETINEKIRNHFYSHPDIKPNLLKMEEKVLNDEMSSFQAAQKLLELYFNSF